MVAPYEEDLIMDDVTDLLGAAPYLFQPKKVPDCFIRPKCKQKLILSL